MDVLNMLDDIESGSQVLGGFGDSVLLASKDRLSAFFRGTLPEGTTYNDAMEILQDAGICYGIKTDAIYDVLPKREVPNSERMKGKRAASSATSGLDSQDVIVAQGKPSVIPQEARLEYRFEMVADGDLEKVEKILERGDIKAVIQCSIALPVVRPGQILAQVVQDRGACGKDVFGAEIPPELPSGMTLESGANTVLTEDGQGIAAEIYGYAGTIKNTIAVVPPIWVSADDLTANFIYLPPLDTYQAPAVADMQALLELCFVEYGIDQRTIARLCKDLERGKRVERIVPIAFGTPPSNGRGAKCVFAFDPPLLEACWEILNLFDKSTNVETLVAKVESLEVKIAATGELLASRKRAIKGVVGRDVYGDEILSEEEEDQELEIGDHVRLGEDGSGYYSEIFGYVGFWNNVVTILSPIWISPDRMCVYFINLPQRDGKTVPSHEEIDRLLKLAGVKYGIDDRAIGIFIEKMKRDISTGIAVPIARGQAPSPGESAYIDFAVDIDEKPGELRKDGSINFKKLNLMPPVEKGQLLGALTPATEGIGGVDVLGQEIPAENGQNMLVKIGRNVRNVQEQEELILFYAEIDGGLVVCDLTENRRGSIGRSIDMAVHYTKVVESDVDYSIGNIDHPGNVEIKGSVKYGFSIKAEGSIAIEGSVEDNVSIISGGHVSVQHGITGSNTRIESNGSVYAKFISDATVFLKNDLVIGSYLYHTSIKSSDSIEVLDQQAANLRGGTIVGGFLLARKQIKAKNIGSETSSAANLVAGIDPINIEKISDINKKIGMLLPAIKRTLLALGLETPDPTKIRHLLKHSKGQKRKNIAHFVKKYSALESERSKALLEKQNLECEFIEMALGATITATGKLFRGTNLRIGNCSIKLEEDALSSIFSLVEGENEDGDKTIQLKMDTQ